MSDIPVPDFTSTIGLNHYYIQYNFLKKNRVEGEEEMEGEDSKSNSTIRKGSGEDASIGGKVQDQRTLSQN